MRYINGWVESIVLHQQWWRIFFQRVDIHVTDEYIEREYTIAGNHLMLTSEHTVKEIEQKARKVMGMLKRGVKFTPTQPDVMKIIENLTEK